ncbi:MAG: nitronate monooxygenase [Patescibacteria group bacterium]
MIFEMEEIMELKEIKIIQGGMGVYISCPALARKVSSLSRFGRETLGTISGVALERLFPRILRQGGEKAEEMIRVLTDFPFRGIAEKVLNEYISKSGKGVPVFSVTPSHALIILTICANFAFVRLAKEGHTNPVSINYLEKIAMPHLFAIYGAMLAGVDYITMGAGIPIQIPTIINAYASGQPASYEIPVIDGDKYVMTFDPRKFFGEEIPQLKRPGFIPIIASNVLAIMLEKKLSKGSIQGFVIEEPTAGGHNAPPRNKISYGDKDIVDYPKIAELGIPFWIGGSYASPGKLEWAQSVGANGIQAGSIFALSEESGMDPKIRQEIRKRGFSGTNVVKTDMRASPTGFPLKVVELTGTVSGESTYQARERVCDQSVLVSAYKKPNGSIGYRCASEPIDAYIKKGGKIEDTVGRKCICNGLITTGNLRFEGENEPAIVTLGDDTSFLTHLMQNENSSYIAEDALNYLLGKST